MEAVARYTHIHLTCVSLYHFISLSHLTNVSLSYIYKCISILHVYRYITSYLCPISQMYLYLTYVPPSRRCASIDRASKACQQLVKLVKHVSSSQECLYLSYVSLSSLCIPLSRKYIAFSCLYFYLACQQLVKLVKHDSSLYFYLSHTYPCLTFVCLSHICASASLIYMPLPFYLIYVSLSHICISISHVGRQLVEAVARYTYVPYVPQSYTMSPVSQA